MVKLILALCLVPIVLASQLGDFKYGLVKVQPNTRDQVDFLKKYALSQNAGFGQGGSSDIPLFITPLARNKEAYVLLPFAGSKKFHETLRQKHIKAMKLEFTTIEGVKVNNSIHEAHSKPYGPGRAGGQLTVIESPRVTNWGVWGNWERCPEGQFVVGMKLKTEGPLGSGDDTALNAIRLLCAVPGSTTYREISSLEGKWGKIGQTFTCHGQAIVQGFELRSEEPQGSGDDTAANNLRLICGQFEIVGDGGIWGEWSGKQYCPQNKAVCGLRTQVEPEQGGGDDTALNNVDMMCCDAPAPAAYQLNRPPQNANNYQNRGQQQGYQNQQWQKMSQYGDAQEQQDSSEEAEQDQE